MSRQPSFVVAASVAFLAFGLAGLAQGPGQGQGSEKPPVVPRDLHERAGRNGRVRVVVELRLHTGVHVPEPRLGDAAAVRAQRQAIAAASSRVLARLTDLAPRVLRQYRTVPYIALELSPGALSQLEQAESDVIRVFEDAILRPSLAASVPIIQADQAWESGYDGTGTTVAVLDSGVDATHPFFGGRVVAEACFSSTVPGTSNTLCPNGLEAQTGAGSAAPCPRSECIHGTHVAGIAAGRGDSAGQSFSGVARGPSIAAVQVFSDVIDPTPCGGVAPCMGAFTSDVIAGLEHVYELATTTSLNIVSVNMSLGGGAFPGYCDTEPYKPAIDNLRAIKVASVVASGNGFNGARISSPACISSAVSVGSTAGAEGVSWFSNVSPVLSLLAPGENIVSSIPNADFAPASGTSMAAPHVTGAWAIIRQGAPGATVSQVLNALRTTGLPVADTRLWAPGTTTVPRVRVLQALATLAPVTSPPPIAESVSPNRVRAGAAAPITVTGSGFNALSVAEWNRVAVPTAVASATRLVATVPASSLALGTSFVRVFNPAPGGGTSAELAVIVDPPASLSVNATTVGPGSSVTVTLANGYGGAQDWIALASKSAPDTSYLTYVYVGTGITSRTWTTTLPSTAGSYEFRLFLNNGYSRVATSPTVTVDPNLNPLPSISSLSPSSAVAGGAGFTLTVNGSGFTAASAVRWNGVNRPTVFVSSTQLQSAVSAADIAAVGSASVSVTTPAPGGGTSDSLAFAIKPAPSLSVNPTSVPTEQPVTVTLNGGLGGASDWLAFASVGSPDTTNISWTYVGAGVTTRTWTVTAPSTTGSYEFRLYRDNVYVRVATSPAVTVTLPPSPAPTVTSLSPSSMPAGAAAFTLAVSGSNFVTTSVVRWNGMNRTTTYFSGSQLRASIPASDLEAIGSAVVTVFTPAPGGGLSGALPFSITPPPSLAVSTITAGGGSSVTVTLSNGLGGAQDWLALASTSAPNTTYIQYVYVGAGLTSLTWAVNMPSTAGTYEFRLFRDNGYTRVATSPAITVSPPPPPSLSVSATTVTPGSPVTVTLTNGYGGAADWIALAVASAPNTSNVQWTYVGGGVKSRTWTVNMPSISGSYEFRLFLDNGYTRAATSSTVIVADASP
jgi:subtilisin